MTLSIIIVNYNVKYFLEHCLCSVQKAIKEIDAEILVIDNCSTDNSLEYLSPLFKNVVFVESKENIGFGKANNLGLKIARGKYVLFLNPDTLIQEDSLKKCLFVFEKDEKIGAVGARMIDGSGKFLKESKRAFPSPATSLYKLFGLSYLFPRSAIFSKYHLGHLSDRENNEVDVLCGAFMMVKKDILDKTSGFDKDFFMYGEDVDLSFRIQELGYKNYYLADTTIIHFKGESTNKGSLNYVKMFYRAMEVFVKKHYGGARKSVFIFLIQVAIWFRALLSIFSGFVKKVGLPFIDAVIFITSFWVATIFWSNYVKTSTNYPQDMLWFAFSIFTIIYLAVAWFWGLYDKAGYRTRNVFYASIFAMFVLLAFYSLLPERYRFSRGIILLGSVLGFTGLLLLRLILNATGVIKSSQKNTIHFAGIIAGSPNEYENVLKILQPTGESDSILNRAGNIKELKEMLVQTGAKKIIFCTGSLSYATIINAVQELPHHLRYRFYNNTGKTIISSHFKNESGAAVAYNKNYRLNDAFYRRLKRLFDILSSFVFIITFPFHLFSLQKPGLFFRNCFAVLIGQKTWIGYSSGSDELLPLKPAVLSVNGVVPKNGDDFQKSNSKLDKWYAREYSVGLDMSRLSAFYKKLCQ